jgi:CheY-like chemotaxis protein
MQTFVIFTEVLSHLGYSILIAATGPEALDALRRDSSIDVFLSDNIMPAGLNDFAAGAHRP